jgi:hypothetical protein
MGITYEWRGAFDSADVSALHAQGFGHPRMRDDWWTRVNRHSLGWVCARLSGELVGFVNVAWDGAAHASCSIRSLPMAFGGVGLGPD